MESVHKRLNKTQLVILKKLLLKELATYNFKQNVPDALYKEELLKLKGKLK